MLATETNAPTGYGGISTMNAEPATCAADGVCNTHGWQRAKPAHRVQHGAHRLAPLDQVIHVEERV